MNQTDIVNDNGDADNGSVQSGAEKEYGVRAVARALGILKCFDIYHPQWTIPELCKQTKLHRASVHRLIKTLENEGFLTYNPETTKYSLGPVVHRAVYLGLSNQELIRVVRPYMEKLTALANETTVLGVWAGEGALVLDTVLTPHMFRPAIPVGKVLTDVYNTHSRLFLAYSSPNVRTNHIPATIEPLTPYSVTDPKSINEIIDKVAQTGIAYDLREYDIGTSSIGVPIRDGTGQVRATLAFVALYERFGPTEMARGIQLLRDAARSLSADLGYQEPGA